MTDTMPDVIFASRHEDDKGVYPYGAWYEFKEDNEGVKYARADLVPKDAVSVPREVLNFIEKVKTLSFKSSSGELADRSIERLALKQDAIILLDSLALLKPYVKGE